MIRSDSSSPEDSNKLSAVAFRTECPNQQKIDFKFFNFVAILICQLKIVEIGHESYRMDRVGCSPDIKKAVLIELLTIFELVNTKRLTGVEISTFRSSGGFQQSLSSLHHVLSFFFICSVERNLIVLLNKLMLCAKGGLSSISFKVKMTIQS